MNKTRSNTINRVTRGWGALAALTLILSLVFSASQAQAVTETWCFNGVSAVDPCASTNTAVMSVGETEAYTGSLGDQIIASGFAVVKVQGPNASITHLSVLLTEVNGGLPNVGLGVNGAINNTATTVSSTFSTTTFTQDYIKLDLGADWNLFTDWKIKVGKETNTLATSFLLSNSNMLLGASFNTFGSLVGFTPNGQFLYVSLPGAFADFPLSGIYLWEIQANRPDRPVPEPSALLMIGLGLMGAVGLRYRRKL